MWFGQGWSASWFFITMLILSAACAETSQRWQEVEGTKLTHEAGEEVILDATSIFADGGAYRWQQLGGPTVPITDPNATVLRFIAPDVSATTSILLSLSNVRGADSATTLFTVTVTPRSLGDSQMDAGSDPPEDAQTDSSDGSQPVAGPGQYIATHSTAAPAIDGDLSEFSGVPPIDLTVSATRTSSSVQLQWDSNNLYIAADVSDSDVKTSISVRDGEVWNDDSIELMFDPGREGGAEFNTGDFKVIVNAIGVQRDTEGTPAGEFDTSWNPDYQVAAVPTASGYRVEIAIPWSAFGLTAAPNSTWGFDLALNDTLTSGATNKVVWRNENGGTVNDPAGWGELAFVQ